MDLTQYQKAAYFAIQEHENNRDEVLHWAVGLGEESGEVLSVIKHKYFSGDYDIEDLVTELGDTLFHISALCTANNISLDDIAQYNLAKLRYRYPDKEFDFGRSKNRHQLDGDFRSSDEAKQIMQKIKMEEKR